MGWGYGKPVSTNNTNGICNWFLYADIFGIIPIADALLTKGALLGTILSFMMGVTTLSIPSLVMLSKAIKPKLLTIFVVICTVGIVAVGYLFNILAVFF